MYEDPDYSSALAAFFTQRWDEAVERLEIVLSRHPNHPQINERLDHARGQRDLRRWDTEAREAAERGEWAAAVNALERLVAAQPDHQDALIRLQQARTQQEIADLQTDLRRLHAAAQWAAVVAVGEQLSSLDPGAGDPEGLVTDAKTQLAEAALLDRYRAGLRHLDANEWDKARATFTALENERPGYRDTPALLALAQQHQHAQTNVPHPKTIAAVEQQREPEQASPTTISADEAQDARPTIAAKDDEPAGANEPHISPADKGAAPPPQIAPSRRPPRSSAAETALGVSIIGLVTCWVPFVPILLNLIGVVLALRAKKQIDQSQGRIAGATMAETALVISIIGLVLAVLLAFSWLTVFS